MVFPGESSLERSRAGRTELWYRGLDSFRASGAYTVQEGLLKNIEVDIGQMVKDPIAADEVIRQLATEISAMRNRCPVDLLAFLSQEGGKNSDIRLAVALSRETSLPHTVVNVSERTINPEGRVEGYNLLLVTGYTETGTKLLQVSDSIFKIGAKVTGIITYAIDHRYFKTPPFEQRNIKIGYVYSVPGDLSENGIKPQQAV